MRRETAWIPLGRLLPVMIAFLVCIAPPAASDTALRQAIASAVDDDANLKRFYEQRAYEPLWTDGSRKAQRRLDAFLDALGDAGDHGLPTGVYRAAELAAAADDARTVAERARLEAALSRAFADYARDIQSGVLVPRRVSDGIKRDAPRRGQAATLSAFAQSSASGFLNALPPQTAEYRALLAEKARLERLVGSGAWGQAVPPGALREGTSGPAVVILRGRLSALGYGRTGKAPRFDADLARTVAGFQRDHGLAPDGVVGAATRAEVNKSPGDRLQQVVVAMERERWMNFPRGRRHVLVNIPDFSASVVDRGKVTFRTRTVVGQNRGNWQTPEFSDVMEFMVVNPTWNVPHSITTKEYLPMLKEDPTAVSHLKLLDQDGNRVSRASVDFSSYSQNDFPYRLKEPPSQGNALGQVKFMFPNRHNIYLHDTPHKALFGRSSRAFSHGCIRLAEPFEFAYTLLERQTNTPERLFQSKLSTGRETIVSLDRPIRVHLIYRTAFVADGAVRYRQDVYGRDAQVFAALADAGVSLRALGG